MEFDMDNGSVVVTFVDARSGDVIDELPMLITELPESKRCRNQGCRK